MKYCESVYQTKRRKTREVMVGNVGVGGNNPIRIQSMTTSDTRNVAATVEQIMRLADYGCEIARVTVQGLKEAQACETIKSTLVQKGYAIPLVADIHFYPPAALHVVDFVDKVRINPGNFVDRRATFKVIEYDDATYAAELEKITEKFAPLVEKCKRRKIAMRIGTNHGSLSDRIMNRYGDTPQGMVESAVEFTRVARDLDYHDIIYSMKASNPFVMIQAYRLLVARMMELGWDYPLHLGVTEAGEGEDGRVKSAFGIGSLLLDGIGDTIRVSLTEDPWAEIDPCRRLVSFYNGKVGKGIEPFEEEQRDFLNIERRELESDLRTDGILVMKLTEEQLRGPEIWERLGFIRKGNSWEETPARVDCILIESFSGDEEIVEQLKQLNIELISDEQYVRVSLEDDWERLLEIKPRLIFFDGGEHPVHGGRKFFEWMKRNDLKTPVILQCDYQCDESDLPIHAAAEVGSLLGDAMGDGLLLVGPGELEDLHRLSLSILQAARMRRVKTEFVSCPGCGRTLFDLQVVTRKIRERTGHLPGVSIAVMGCIVNGPGEMADSDFGYVGSKAGKIDLYVGKKCVERYIDEDIAVERLVDLIKAHDRWVEPQCVEV